MSVWYTRSCVRVITTLLHWYFNSTIFADTSKGFPISIFIHRTPTYHPCSKRLCHWSVLFDVFSLLHPGYTIYSKNSLVFHIVLFRKDVRIFHCSRFLWGSARNKFALCIKNGYPKKYLIYTFRPEAQINKINEVYSTFIS